MSESFEKAVEAASLAMLGRPTLSATTIRAALRAALPHLTAQDVPHLIRQAKAEAWGEGYRTSDVAWVHAYSGHPVLEGEMCPGCRPSNPYAEEATNDHA